MKTCLSRFIVSVIVVSVLLPCVSVCYGVGNLSKITLIRSLASDEYECDLNFWGDDIERIQITMPWGYVYDTNDFMPGGWGGEPVQYNDSDPNGWYRANVKLEESGELYFEFRSGFDSSARWDTLDTTDVDIIVTYTDQTTWTDSLDFDDAVIPTEIPVFTYPINDQNDVYLRLTLEWQQWQNPPPGSSIELYLEESSNGEEVFDLDIAVDATQWHAIETLKANTAYSAELCFIDGGILSEANGVDVLSFGSTYTKIDFESGNPYVMQWRGFYHDRYLYNFVARVDDIERLQVTMPWGDTFDSNDFLPVDWNGEDFGEEVFFDGDQSEFWFKVFGDNGAVEFSFIWWFDLESYWTAFDSNEIQVTMTRGQNPVWDESLDASGIIIPSQTPVFVYPLDQQSNIWRKPTFQWQDWLSPPGSTFNGMEFFIIESGIDIAEAKDLTSDANDWTSPLVLQANTNYEASLIFTSEIASSYVNGLEIYNTGFREASVEFTTRFSTATGPDFDSDGQVNINDLARLAMFWLGSEPSVDIAPEGGDGVINLLDFNELVSNWNENSISDHVFDILMIRGFEYDQVDSVAEYAFVIEFETDATVDKIEFTTPGDEIFEITNADETNVALAGGEVITERSYNSDSGLYEWIYEVETINEDEVVAYDDGQYSITVYYVNGSSQETTVWFGVPGTTNPISQPLQDPKITSIAHGSTSLPPVTFAWVACTDPVANQIRFSLEDRDTGEYIIDEVLAVSATSLSEPHTIPGQWEAWLGFETRYTGQNNDSINFEIGKYCDRGFQFTVTGTPADAISDHVYGLEINTALNHIQEPNGTDNLEYAFQIAFGTDNAVERIEFLTPDANTFEITNAAYTSTAVANGSIQTRRWYNSQDDIYEWEYEGFFSTPASLDPYGDGNYTITVYYVDGNAHQTTAWFGEPGTSNPIVIPTQEADLTSFSDEAVLVSPITFTWNQCTDSAANMVYFGLENSDTGEEFDQELAVNATEPVGQQNLSNGSWVLELSFEVWYNSLNVDGIEILTGKYKASLYDFTVVSP
ncbi:MAG: hypothetical protein FVQ82_15150 [Planctomycetes bacterium]|nr:hypothetical protein [Planctomycetota bacterium]